jgi:hypothetical protein
MVGDSTNGEDYDQDCVGDFNARYNAVRESWSHPLSLVIIMLDAQLEALDHGVTDNNKAVTDIESDVEKLLNTEQPKQKHDTQPNIPRHMVNAHTALKGSIKLLDAVRWMSRAIAVLIEAGKELSEEAIKLPDSSLERDWVHIKQYLEDMSRLCDSLAADPMMSEKRCQAQIDIVC